MADMPPEKFAAVVLQHLEPEIRRIVQDEVARYAIEAVDHALSYRRVEAAEIPLAEHPEVGVQMPMRRHYYYNPVLDPDVQARKMTDAMREAVQENRYGWATEPSGPRWNR